MSEISDLTYVYDPEDRRNEWDEWMAQFADGATEGFLIFWDAKTGEQVGYAAVTAVVVDGEGFISARTEEQPK